MVASMAYTQQSGLRPCCFTGVAGSRTSSMSTAVSPAVADPPADFSSRCGLPHEAITSSASTTAHAILFGHATENLCNLM